MRSRSTTGAPRWTGTDKGGHREIIVWDAATARLLPRYLAGRRRGPLFVTTGLPNIVPAELDRSPDGRGRLSYQRAWSLFREASGGQWTLHQLRHSALTHLGEDGVSAPLLMAKSRHRDLRTLSRYVCPGTKAVARLTAEHDPARPGKHPRRSRKTPGFRSIATRTPETQLLLIPDFLNPTLRRCADSRCPGGHR